MSNKHQIENISSISEEIDELKNIDFADILLENNLEFTSVGFYYQSPVIPEKTGWIFHISVIKSQLVHALQSVLSFVAETEIPFKVCQNIKAASMILDGEGGLDTLGKVITLYPPQDQLLSTAEKLINITKEFKGPFILTDAYLGGTLYTRYGGFRFVPGFDQYGNNFKVRKNRDGQWEKDIYSCPFVLSDEQSWLFNEISKDPVVFEEARFTNSINIVKNISENFKGNVWEADLMIGNESNKCIVKEGRRSQWSDDAGRDMTDRISWQAELLNRLQNRVRVPKVYDVFSLNGNKYVVMALVNGKSFTSAIEDIYSGHTAWKSLDPVLKQIVRGYIAQLIEIVRNLHEMGIVHRDITPENFIVDSHGQIWMIDIEMAYDIKNDYPDPPFNMGTRGYMSPAQQRNYKPGYEDDIYSLGAMILFSVTGIHPRFFPTLSERRLKMSLDQLLESDNIKDLILECMSVDPLRRPVARELLPSLTNARFDPTTIGRSILKSWATSIDQIQHTIQSAINGLGSHPYIVRQGLWKYPPDNRSSNKLFNTPLNIFEGLSGTLYLLARAKRMGYDISQVAFMIEASIEYITSEYRKKEKLDSTGLFFGSSGLGLAFVELMKSGLCPVSGEYQLLISKMLHPEYADISLCSGISGMMIGLLNSKGYISDDWMKIFRRSILRLLLENKINPGFWVGGNSSILSRFGLQLGNAGVALLITRMAGLDTSDEYTSLALEALNYQMEKVNEQLSAFWHNGYSLVDHDSIEFVLGNLILLLEGFSWNENEAYLKSVEKLFDLLPEYYVSSIISQNCGISHVGEVYLEGLRVSKSERWKQRLDWIVSFLTNSTKWPGKSACYWSSEGRAPSPSLMTGNAGIIHLLMRYLNPEDLRMILLW